jgi:hypothetical protein
VISHCSYYTSASSPVHQRDIHLYQAYCASSIMASTHLSRKMVAIVDNDDDELQIEESDSFPAHPKYQYTKLPYGHHLRLLELLPGDSQSSLRCRLPIFHLNAYNIPEYQALSYTWCESKYDRLIVAGERVPINSILCQEYASRHPIHLWKGSSSYLHQFT